MNTSRPFLEVHGAEASSVIVQHIPPKSVDVFMEWQRGVGAAAAKFPGYQTTEIYTPQKQEDQWVVVMHFDDSKTMKGWLDSPTRAEWVAKLPDEVRNFKLKTVPAGMGAWFAGLDDGALPPHWKNFLSVLVVLYPTVALLNIYVLPPPSRFGLALTILAGNTLSVSFLEWVCAPILNPLFAPWLRAKGKEGRALSIRGGLLMLALVPAMAYVFHLLSS